MGASYVVRNLRFDAGWVRPSLLALAHSIDLLDLGHG